MKRMILAAATCLLAIPVAMATDDFNTTIQNMKDSNTTTDFDAIYHKYVELTPEYKANLNNSNFPVQNRRKALCDKG